MPGTTIICTVGICLYITGVKAKGGTMNCTKCSAAMVETNFQGLNLLCCKTCNFLCLKEAVFNEIIKRLNIKDHVNLFDLEPISVKEATRNCPICGKPMEKIYHNGVLIDRCPECRILCFDNGELSKYFCSIMNIQIELMANTSFIRKFCLQSTNSLPEHSNPEPIQLQSKEKEYAADSVSGWLIVAIMAFAFLFSLIFLLIPFLIPLSIIIYVTLVFVAKGFKILNPQEALVLTVFGKYIGTLKGAGFHWVSPFATSRTIRPLSLKARTLENGKQKINDELGNPIEVGIIVVWEVLDTAKAVFNVDDYSSFLAAQSDCALRNIVRMYPYDTPEDSDKQSLRGDSMEISEKLKNEIQRNVTEAGINVVDARITHLAYSPEIAAAMLQRQQASAIIDARRAIVDGAVGMVEMALQKLEQNKDLNLDEKTKANMVNNLLVVLCGNKESTPVIRNDRL